MTHPQHAERRLFQARAAAAYLGMSESKLRTTGIPRKVMNGNRVYERSDLDAFADSLPYEADEAEQQGVSACDAAFGIGPE